MLASRHVAHLQRMSCAELISARTMSDRFESIEATVKEEPGDSPVTLPAGLRSRVPFRGGSADKHGQGEV